MSSTPVLALPDFELAFVIETDACEKGVGAVLSQNGHPIIFLENLSVPTTRNFLHMRKSFWQCLWLWTSGGLIYLDNLLSFKQTTKVYPFAGPEFIY
jgi:hypothetical protein